MGFAAFAALTILRRRDPDMRLGIPPSSPKKDGVQQGKRARYTVASPLASDFVGARTAVLSHGRNQVKPAYSRRSSQQANGGPRCGDVGALAYRRERVLEYRP
jgi:hypothetical protein